MFYINILCKHVLYVKHKHIMSSLIVEHLESILRVATIPIQPYINELVPKMKRQPLN